MKFFMMLVGLLIACHVGAACRQPKEPYIYGVVPAKEGGIVFSELNDIYHFDFLRERSRFLFDYGWAINGHRIGLFPYPDEEGGYLVFSRGRLWLSDSDLSVGPLKSKPLVAKSNGTQQGFLTQDGLFVRQGLQWNRIELKGAEDFAFYKDEFIIVGDGFVYKGGYQEGHRLTELNGHACSVTVDNDHWYVGYDNGDLIRLNNNTIEQREPLGFGVLSYLSIKNGVGFVVNDLGHLKSFKNDVLSENLMLKELAERRVFDGAYEGRNGDVHLVLSSESRKNITLKPRIVSVDIETGQVNYYINVNPMKPRLYEHESDPERVMVNPGNRRLR